MITLAIGLLIIFLMIRSCMRSLKDLKDLKEIESKITDPAVLKGNLSEQTRKKFSIFITMLVYALLLTVIMIRLYNAFVHIF